MLKTLRHVKYRCNSQNLHQQICGGLIQSYEFDQVAETGFPGKITGQLYSLPPVGSLSSLTAFHLPMMNGELTNLV